MLKNRVIVFPYLKDHFSDPAAFYSVIMISTSKKPIFTSKRHLQSLSKYKHNINIVTKMFNQPFCNFGETTCRWAYRRYIYY